MAGPIGFKTLQAQSKILAESSSAQVRNMIVDDVTAVSILLGTQTNIRAVEMEPGKGWRTSGLSACIENEQILIQ